MSKKYLFFDTETTGLPGISDPTRYGHTHSRNGQPRFVELAWIKYIDKKSTGGCDMFIRPSDFQMPAETSRFNGITSRMLAERGLEENIILNAFMLAVKEADILVGHNVSFDIGVVASRLRELGRDSDADVLESKPVICTMQESTDLCRLPKVEGKHYDYDGEFKYPRLGELHWFLFGKDFDGAHGAQADTSATARCFFELVKRNIINPEKLTISVTDYIKKIRTEVVKKGKKEGKSYFLDIEDAYLDGKTVEAIDINDDGDIYALINGDKIYSEEWTCDESEQLLNISKKANKTEILNHENI